MVILKKLVRKLLTTGFMFLLVFGDVGKVGVLEIACAFFVFLIFVGRSKCGKME